MWSWHVVGPVRGGQSCVSLPPGLGPGVDVSLGVDGHQRVGPYLSPSDTPKFYPLLTLNYTKPFYLAQFMPDIL